MRVRAVAAALAVCLLALAARAGDGRAEGFRVVGIDVTGAQRVKPETVLSLMKTRVGADLDLAAIREDVKAIWRYGYFTDVRIDSEAVEGGVRLDVIVAEKPIVSEVAFTGNKEVETSDLRNAATLKDRSLFQEDRVKESARKMLEVYRNKGFYDASVEPSVSEEPDGSVRVEFRVKEGEKVKIVRIDITGTAALTTRDVRKVMETKEKGFFSFITDSGTYKKDQLEADVYRIELLYQNNGFLDSKVSDPAIRRVPEGLALAIHVFEGKQYRVGNVRVAGETEVPREELARQVRLARGEIFRRERLMEDIRDMTTTLNDRGYAEANIQPKVEKDAKYPLADVTYSVDQGGKFRFGTVEVVGNSKTFDRVVRRQLEVADGQVYTATGLRVSKENLMRTSYFKDVKIVPENAPVPGVKDVRVEVQEGPTGTLSGGLGFSSVDKLFGVVQVSENNLFGRGWRTSLNSQFGARKTVFSLDLREPHLFDTDYSVMLNAYNTKTQYSDFERKARGGKVGMGYNFTRFTDGSVTLRIDSSEVIDTGAAVSSILREEFAKGTQHTRSIGVNLTRNTTDRFIDPSRGTVESASVEWAGGPLGGQSRFVKYFLNAKAFFPVTESTVLSGNILWGHVVPTTGGDRVPLFERFFLGGPYSVRGFKSRDLSPVDPNTGEQIGGNKELVLNVEWVFPLLNEVGFKGVLFFDAGNTWRQSHWPFSPEKIRYAAGAGIRWYSPMGPLRFEWGWNLDPEPGESRRVAEFTIGTAF